MSTFAVTVEQLANIYPHENADRLEMATLSGKDYAFVVGKGEFTAGDTVIYFPVDSLLPMSIVEALNLAGKLAHGAIPEIGEERLQNRVKTVKLRGNLSQGVVCDPKSIANLFPEIDFDHLQIGDDLTQQFGVTKYEPPVVPSRYGNLVGLPNMVRVYDIEGAQNFVDIVDTYLMDAPVYITEKVEGSNWWATINKNGDIRIGQRNYEIVDVVDNKHDWYKVFYMQGLDAKLHQMWSILSEKYGTTMQLVNLRGEMTGPGIQGNYYRLKDFAVYTFDIEVNGIAINADEFLAITDQFDITRVPILAVDVSLRDWLDGRSLKIAADGESKIAPVKREGIVIKPMKEETDPRLGRVFIKQHSLDYLAKSKL